jgi:hypothetical protein
MGASLVLTGDITEGRSHYDQALALYDPAEHRSLAMRFAQDIRVAILSYRSQALWLLGYPEAALADTKNALGDARAIGQATTLMYAQSRLNSVRRFGLVMAGETQRFWVHQVPKTTAAVERRINLTLRRMIPVHQPRQTPQWS